ncbi:unnamed protein product [Bursaphelenchus xylophilus]|uniref:(pine wood nematode) hypothetical protein n=1 Tax=Bursaphelenchus xylophilus TaxID=6326 RepID=A0A1I7SCU8_BURXY|nr:unnamed protein product [Bursaphelenchus xylophilus]CAG9093449.1 unnamed protein product [Bursaphelenchus xylophilus]
MKIKPNEEEQFIKKTADSKRSTSTLITAIFVFLTLLTVCTVAFALVSASHLYGRSKRNMNFDDIFPSLPPPQERSLSRQSRALKLEKSVKCLKINCLAGFDFDERTIQTEIDVDLGRRLFEMEPKDETEEKVVLSFLKCMENLNENSAKHTFLDVYNKIMDIEEFVDKLSVEPNISLAQGLTRIALIFWRELGINTFFEHRSFWNFDRDDQHRRLTVYLKQKTPPKLDKKLVSMVGKGAQVTNRRTGATDVLQFFNHSANSKLLQKRYSSNPLDWIALSVAEANQRWPFFDFAEYFHKLGYPMNNYADEVEMKFVVESVEYLDALDDYLQNAKKPAAFAFLHYLGFYTTLFEYKDHYLTEQFEANWKKSLNQDESLRRCASQLRQFLPVAVSKIYMSEMEESDKDLMITEALSVYNYTHYNEVADFVRVYEVNRDFTRIFEKENYHKRLNYDKLNGTLLDTMVELRHFAHLRDVLTLIHSNSDDYVSELSYKSALTVLPEYIAQEQTMYVPLGIMNLLQNIYDDHSYALDDSTRFEKMLSTLKCLIRSKRRKGDLDIWEDGINRKTRGLLKDPKSIRRIRSSTENC